jgi:hypothetical protein
MEIQIQIKKGNYFVKHKESKEENKKMLERANNKNINVRKNHFEELNPTLTPFDEEGKRIMIYKERKDDDRIQQIEQSLPLRTIYEKVQKEWRK